MSSYTVVTSQKRMNSKQEIFTELLRNTPKTGTKKRRMKIAGPRTMQQHPLASPVRRTTSRRCSCEGLRGVALPSSHGSALSHRSNQCIGPARLSSLGSSYPVAKIRGQIFAVACPVCSRMTMKHGWGDPGGARSECDGKIVSVVERAPLKLHAS